MKAITILTFFISFQILGQEMYNIDLQKRIFTMYTSDQECREELRKFKNNEIDTTTIKLSEIETKIRITDSLNYFELKAILDKFGFPGYNLVGEDYSNAFWNILQHQDNNPDFQKVSLEKMKLEVNRNNASKTYYAYLIDRVKVNTGEKQIYGTQMQLNAESTSYEPKPTIKPKKLNERRRMVDLPPIEEYIETMNTRYIGTLKKQ